ncbi:MAG: TadE/TadG family type IV pilus assembly protein [Gemmatimonadota bacterium]
MKTIRRWTRGLRNGAARFGESGQALAEVAIALPLLLLLLIGIWEFARAYQIQQVVVNAAREGAREVVLPNRNEGESDEIGTVATATAKANDYLAAGNVSCPSPPCVTITGDDGDSGDPMTVEISVPYSFNFLGPMIRLVTGSEDSGPGDIMLSSTATMRHE